MFLERFVIMGCWRNLSESGMRNGGDVAKAVYELSALISEFAGGYVVVVFWKRRVGWLRFMSRYVRVLGFTARPLI